MGRPPELFPVAVAGAGALALAVGTVAALNGNVWGIALALGGALLLWWSIGATRKG